MKFSIDGLEFDVRAKLIRTAEMTASELSGMLLDGSYFNDVLGTFMAYDLTLSDPLYDQEKYARLYEILTAPVDGHAFVLPYNGSTLQITGRVAEVTDERAELPGGRAYWKAIRFTVISNAPSKTMSLSQVIARGRSPLPEIATAQVGDLVEYTANGWVPAEYGDSDTTRY